MPKLSEAVDEYVAIQKARRDASDETLMNHLNVLRMFVRMSGDKQASNVTSHHVEQFFYGPGGLRNDHVVYSSGVKRVVGPVSARTHNHYRQRLATFFKWCTSKGYMKRDVMVEIRPLKVHRQARSRPEPATLLRLLDVTQNPRDRAYIATAINTALRASEIRTLRVGDVDLESGYLAVTIRKTGEVDDQPISLDLDNELRRWLTTYSADLGRPLRSEDALFPVRQMRFITHWETAPDGTRSPVRRPSQWQPCQPLGDTTHRIVKDALEALGIDSYREGTHTIRRAVALAYFQHVSADQGDVAALRETSALLHHSSVATTEIYLGMTPEKNRRDRRIKGQPFLSAMIPDEDNVVRIAR